ncbi:HTH-type transcriptional regulator DmlR [bacterium BMS3Bbin11]|nr:HTH-type transcriptional regulator DmlR [bacterium BMS3Abin11]GBE45327.1 HTH-type transcriptional regulator DmlR [bacterium BMS3Bbin11]HDH08555.1 LysR family transcriptional regulator [Gammaproteobacteria bacterium]HDH16251.1 LysR family transcriptional regulator [Gammaproteobacteria bacterium]HDZ79343.1 LysR family transcriptional regulator [Gammaproteobacteria bacterium]
MDKFNKMKTFCCAAETLSFSRTADILQISPSMVSKHISALETELDTRLFSRTTRQIILTQEGKTYQKQCGLILDELDEVETSIRSEARADAGRLRLSLPIDFGIKILAPMLADYLDKHPNVTLDTVYDNRYVDLIKGRYDLAIRIGAKFPDSALIAKRLIPTCAVLCASPDYIKKNRPIHSIQDLKQHNCIQYSNSHNQQHWRINGPEGESLIRINSNLRSNSDNSIMIAALRGLGVALLPCFLVNNHLASGDLIHLLPEYSVNNMGIYAVYPQQTYLPSKVKTFIEFLRTSLQHKRHCNKKLHKNLRCIAIHLDSTSD